MALSKLKQIERMVKVEEPNKYDLKSFKTNFSIEQESGNNVLSVEDLEIGYTNPLSKVSFKLYKGQRLGIIGENGIGKSTLLKTLVNNIPAISGKYEFGHNVKIGYFDQQMAMLNSEKTLFDDFYETFPNLTVTEVRNSLAAFMFYGDDVFKTISMLSGGEKVRLVLCKILKTGPNLLILDEPTNHMDIVGKESLENLLKAYSGTIIFVSHDRFFVNKIADCILSFENGKAEFYDYGYKYYLEKKMEQNKEQVIIEKKAKEIKKQYNNPLKEKDKLERKIRKLEEEISKKEDEINILQNEMLKDDVCSDYIKVTEIQNKINDLTQEVNECMSTWEELENELEKFN
jgi:ATP-binding cassette subfamily F protein 3